MFDQLVLKQIIERGAVPYKEGAISFILNCPRCRKQKLYIRKSDGRYICFVCKNKYSMSGKAEYILNELYSISIEELREKLYGTSTYDFKSSLELNIQDPWESPLEDVEYALPEMQFPEDFVDLSNSLFKDGLDYLNGRGITQEIVSKYDIRFAYNKNRVIFPVKVDNKLYGWQARYIKNTNFTDSSGNLIKIPKMVTSTGLKKDFFLMFQDNLKNSDHCVLAEGPISSLKAEMCGGNVASMGKNVSNNQLNIIKSKVSKLYIALDPDAMSEVEGIARKMYGEMDEIYYLAPPKGKEDLGEASYEEVFDQFMHAERLCGQVFINLG